MFLSLEIYLYLPIHIHKGMHIHHPGRKYICKNYFLQIGMATYVIFRAASFT